MLAVALEDHDAEIGFVAELIHRREHAVDEPGVIGIVHLGTVQRDGCDAARVEIPQNRIGSHSAAPLFGIFVMPDNRPGSQPLSPPPTIGGRTAASCLPCRRTRSALGQSPRTRPFARRSTSYRQ